MNQFEVGARAVKVSRLVEAIDRTFGRVLQTPQPVQARSILICMQEWQQPCWELLCSEAGTKAPSEKTIAQIRAIYERRARQ